MMQLIPLALSKTNPGLTHQSWRGKRYRPNWTTVVVGGNVYRITTVTGQNRDA